MYMLSAARTPSTPPASPSIPNSHNPRTDPDFRTCWLLAGLKDDSKRNYGSQTHVTFDDSCTPDVHGCGAYGHAQCRSLVCTGL